MYRSLEECRGEDNDEQILSFFESIATHQYDCVSPRRIHLGDRCGEHSGKIFWDEVSG